MHTGSSYVPIFFWFVFFFHDQAEAALAQSDFNIEKITEIQNKFTGGAVSELESP